MERDRRSARLARRAWPCKRESLSPSRSTLSMLVMREIEKKAKARATQHFLFFLERGRERENTERNERSGG